MTAGARGSIRRGCRGTGKVGDWKLVSRDYRVGIVVPMRMTNWQMARDAPRRRNAVSDDTISD